MLFMLRTGIAGVKGAQRNPEGSVRPSWYRLTKTTVHLITRSNVFGPARICVGLGH